MITRLEDDGWMGADPSDNETEATTGNNQLNTSESEDEAWDEEDNLPLPF